MSNQLTSNAEALRLFFTEDIYLIADAAEVASAETLTTTSQNSKTEFKHLGKNQKNILLLVNDSEHEVSTAQGRELLRKLVKAIDLTANDFALVNYSDYSLEKYEDLKDFFKCTLMIAFGVDPGSLNLPSQPFNQLNQYKDAKLLFAKNLHDLDSDQASKKVLWASLQLLK